MKRIVLLIVILATAAAQALAAHTCPATGRVVDPQGEGVGYASVVLLRGTEQQAGMSTDAQGRFELKVPAGDYTLVVQFLGYETIERPVRIEERNDLGEIVLEPSSTDIDGVVVEARLIRREADRFVVDVANSPAALGKDGVELLEHAPGVWIDGEKITVNGKSGSKVYVNDRELRMQPEQLLTYLRSLRAEEIRKIEVVPASGADYDADSSGGIIRITLKRRREDGIQGSVGIRTDQSGLANVWVPSGDLAYHRGRLDLNLSSVWGYLGSNKVYSNEQTLYTGSDKQLAAESEIASRSRNGGANVSAVYELSDRHSIGAELAYYRSGEPEDTRTSSRMAAAQATSTESRYLGRDRSDSYNATFNYIWKIDTLGSTFKVLGDYFHRKSLAGYDNASRITPPTPAAAVDSLYRNDTRSTYDVAALTLALEKRFSPRWGLKAGAKYTHNDMRNDALYEWLRGEEWLRNDAQSYAYDYVENIAALYGIATADLGRWSLVAGIRGEYTSTRGRGGEARQEYFSLFPNANLSYSLTEDGAYTLIAQYARTIQRPSFWNLSPRRMQISDYTYQVGNPHLAPAYSDDVSLTLVLAHKYTLTAGATLQRDEINQTIVADADNPDMLGALWVNYDDTEAYYLTANLPFRPAKWMSLNVSATYMRRGERLDRSAPEVFRNMVQARAAATFTLPAKFYIDLSYRFQGRMTFGSATVDPMHRLSAGVKKRFGERFTAAASVENLLDQGQTVRARGEGFERSVRMRQMWSNRYFKASFVYHFKAGKAFRNKSVESGAAEEKGRM